MATRMYEFEAEEAYAELLNESYPPVKLTGDAEYGVGDILKLVDPIMFEIGLGEYIVSMVEDGVWTVEGYEEYEPEVA